MQLQWIAFLPLLQLYNVKCLIVKPQKHCVPTITVKGPCHVCVCNADGLFICHSTPCPKANFNPRKSTKGECQPFITYRFEELFCTCNYEGKWMSFNCRETFQSLQPDKTMLKHTLRSNITCTPNALFLIDCNICQCDKSGVLQPSSCTNRLCNSKGHKADTCKFGDFLRIADEICVCSDIDYYVDKLCAKVGNNTLQELKLQDVAVITNINQIRKNLESNSCIPHKEYLIDCNRCVCDDQRELVCTDKVCSLKTVALRSGDENNGFYNLPQAKDERDDCEPGQKYRIKCNSCVCTHKRTLSCTTMVCLEDFIFDERALAASLLPDPIDHEDLPDIRDGESCVSGKLYKMSCNTCQCRERNALLCTKMACFENALLTEIKQLKEAKNKSQNDVNKDIYLRKRSSDKGKKMSEVKDYPKLPTEKCAQGKIYRKGCKKCFCNEKKNAVCTRSCSNGFPSRFNDKEMSEMETRSVLDLPELPHMGIKCEPGKTYYVVCNICFCTHKHDLFCSMKYCINIASYADVHSKELTGSPCKNDFKSLCNQCKCVNNKTACKVIPDCGKNMSGKQLLSSAAATNVKLTLDIKKDKCKPNVTYKFHCNECYCQPDGSLRCTQKVCLTYSQTKDLQEKETYLEEHGF